MALKSKNAAFQENRKSSRYPVEADAHIRCKSFSCVERTVGLSAAGFSIADSLPESLVGQVIDVEISYSTSSKEILKAKAQCRLAQGSLKRLEVLKPKNAFHDLLEEIWGIV